MHAWWLAWAAVLASVTACERGSTSKAGPAAGLRDGDLVFQESTSQQSEMVRALTRSRWTHMGVVFVDHAGPFVLEATSPVRRTPFAKWVARGRDGRYVVKRLRDAQRLDQGAVGKMRKLGNSWLGKPYDLQFRWDDRSLYCSELAHKLFAEAAGVTLGKIERASDMNLSDDRVEHALRQRFARGGFDPDEPVVTPDSIFNDEKLVVVE